MRTNYVVYSEKRRTPDGGTWRVATFLRRENAERYVEDRKTCDLRIMAASATRADLMLAGDGWVDRG